MPSETNEDAKFTLMELANIIWQRRRFVAAFVFVSVLLSIVYALVVTPQYRSEALVRAATPLASGNAGLGSFNLGGGLESLASLAALGGTNPNVSEAVAIMESRSFTEALLLNDGIIYHIYEDFWDAETSQWRTGKPGAMGVINSWYRAAINLVSGSSKKKTVSGKKGYSGPSLEEAIEEFSDLRKFTVDRRTQFITISVDWKDPIIARDWVTQIVLKINQTTRARAKKEAEMAMEFLRGRIAEERNLVTRSTMLALFQEQLRRVMMTEVMENYSLQFIDAPFIPEKRVSPRRKTIVIITFLLSFIMAVGIVFLTNAIAYHKTKIGN